MHTRTLPTASPRIPAQAAADTFPRWVLLCAAGIVLFSLLSVAAVRLSGNGPDQRVAAAGPQASLRFEDRSDGSIAVVDGRSDRLVMRIEGEQGFVRGALRALARERKARGVGAEQPFQLMTTSAGGLVLFDPVTSQRVELASFGPTNAAAFARLLPGAAAQPSTPEHRP